SRRWTITAPSRPRRATRADFSLSLVRRRSEVPHPLPGAAFDEGEVAQLDPTSSEGQRPRFLGGAQHLVDRGPCRTCQPRQILLSERDRDGVAQWAVEAGDAHELSQDTFVRRDEQRFEQSCRQHRELCREDLDEHLVDLWLALPQL